MSTDIVNAEEGSIEPDEAVGRRRLLVLGSAGLAAAAASAVAGLAASPEARAANGNNIVIGSANTGSSNTDLTSSGGFDTFSAHNNPGSGVANALAGYSNSTSGRGVFGSATGSGWGVLGNTSRGTGVAGNSVSGVGVYGTTSTWVAVQALASGTGTALEATSSKGPVLQLNQPTGTLSVPPTSGTWTQGSFLVDTGGGLWYCFKTGTPGRWAKLSGVLIPLASAVRAYDSRTSGGPLTAGSTRTVSLTSAFPAGLIPTAVLVNLTVTNTVGNGGYLTLWKAGAARPSTSNINWFATGLSLANNATVPVNASGQIDVFAGNQQTDFIVDVLGYYP